jgi:cytochrome-b5 reductase
VAAVVPAGKCVFGEEFAVAPLVSKEMVSHDTNLYTFGLAEEAALGLSTCACILARGGADEEGKPIVRPYTPVSTNALLGKFELMVKTYPGGLSKHMSEMAVGDTLDFKHIPFNVKTQYPFQKKHIGMLVGGTGITPMIQALHAILGTPGDETRISMLFGSRTIKDILCKDTLDEWSASFGDRLAVTHVLSEETCEEWKGPTGFITQDLIKSHLPPASGGSDIQIWICGPPPMYDALCGPRGEQDVSGVLAEMGYSSEQVYKF